MKPILPHAWCLTWLSVAMAGPALAADGAFQLGTVDVVGSPMASQPPNDTRLSQTSLRQFNRDTLGEAVTLTPGVSLSRNSRNEDMVYLRGFDPVRDKPRPSGRGRIARTAQPSFGV